MNTKNFVTITVKEVIASQEEALSPPKETAFLTIQEAKALQQFLQKAGLEDVTDRTSGGIFGREDTLTLSGIMKIQSLLSDGLLLADQP